MNPGPPRPHSGNSRSTPPLSNLTTINSSGELKRNVSTPRNINIESADTYKIIHTNSIDMILKKYNSEEKTILKSMSNPILIFSFITHHLVHRFSKRVFETPTFCVFSSKFIWGLDKTGFECDGILLIYPFFS